MELSLEGEHWLSVATGLHEPLVPEADGEYAGWPLLGDVLCWNGRGIQFSRSWPVSEDKDACRQRWDELVNAAGKEGQKALLSGSRDADITRSYPSFLHPGERLARLDSLPKGSPPDGIERIGFRSFDRQWAVADRRVIDMPRPALWQVRSGSQIYFTTSVPYSAGPVLVASTDVPDLNAFNNRGGVTYPLYRDAAATRFNIAPGLSDHLSKTYERTVVDEDVAAYLYGLLGTGAYAARFRDKTGGQSLPVPFTAVGPLFAEVAALGRELLWWHTWGERFAPADAAGARMSTLPEGSAKNTVALTSLPDEVSYDADTGVLSVGEGEFSPVTPEQWNFTVSGMKVVQSWLGYRRVKRAGKTSSDLDKVRPVQWTASRELVSLLGILERTLDLEPEADSLLGRVLAGPLLTNLPKPPPEFMNAPSDSDDLAAGQGSLI